MSDQDTKTKPNLDTFTTTAIQYYEINANKNKLISSERKIQEQLKKMVAPDDKVRSVEIDANNALDIGWVTEQSEEIDPKKLFELDKDAFWELVSIPKTAAIAHLGEKRAAKVMRTATKHDFKIKKRKLDK